VLAAVARATSNDSADYMRLIIFINILEKRTEAFSVAHRKNSSCVS